MYRSVFLALWAAAALAGPAAAQDGLAGWYLGIHLGAGNGQFDMPMRSHVTTPNSTYNVNADASLSPIGLIGGIQGGYNRVTPEGWLIGAEIDFTGGTTGAQVRSTQAVNATTDADLTNQAAVPFIGTARLRGGYVLPNDILLFATAGFAYGGVDVRQEATAVAGTETVQSSVSRLAVRTGWTAGLGLEMPLGDGLSVRTEYLYVDLGNHVLADATFSTPMASGNVDFEASAAIHVARVTLNYFLN